ncbi:MAG: glycosyltransferase [Myxococcota bacterium]|nr:glycosyltransferase [Myxococcota bacterium]
MASDTTAEIGPASTHSLRASGNASTDRPLEPACSETGRRERPGTAAYRPIPLPPPQAAGTLDASIIVPTYQRPEAIRRCLAALERLDYSHDRFEVIVVDDGSEPPVAQSLKRFEESLTLVLLRQDNAGPASARNHGATVARGKLLFFTDDDCAPTPQWLKQVFESARDNPQAAIGGRTVNALVESALSEASQMLVDYLYEYYNIASTGGERMFTSNNLMIPARAFREMGGFAKGFPRAAAEDREICDRWHDSGRMMIYEPVAVIEHSHPLDFVRFVLQHFGYGRGAAHFQRLRSARGRTKKIEPFRFYLDLVLYPFGRKPALRALQISALFVVAQVSNAAGYFWQSWRSA